MGVYACSTTSAAAAAAAAVVAQRRQQRQRRWAWSSSASPPSLLAGCWTSGVLPSSSSRRERLAGGLGEHRDIELAAFGSASQLCAWTGSYDAACRHRRRVGGQRWAVVCAADADKKGSSGRPSSGIRLENVSKTYKQNNILQNVSWDVKSGEKLGLVGENGAGKTTQLKIIVGEVEPDSGEILKAKDNMKIAYLTQEFEVVPSRTLREELRSASEETVYVVERLEAVQKGIEESTEDMDEMTRLLEELDKLQKEADSLDIYSFDARIDKIMPELGFEPEDNDRLVASFSGGWQMRMSLGKMLLQEPDLLLCDEPTNHLDLETIQWLEGYLKKLDVPMVIVSHDREFLDRICNKIVETERGVATTFKGNYSEYVSAKQVKIEEKILAYEKQQKEIERLREMIRRLSAGSNSGRASQAQKELDKIIEEGVIEKPFIPKRIPYEFPDTEKSGRDVIVISGLSHGYGSKQLFEDVSLKVERGERVAFIGPNGAGKSTLLRLIMRQEDSDEGEARLGDYNVKVNYFAQNQAEFLELNRTVLETMEEAAPNWDRGKMKALLGRFLFKGEDVNKKVSVLSGGEKARLAMAKFMATPATLLILDEPTNHLDIPSKELLEQALRSYNGTVVAVSHDRYFLRQIVTRVVEVRDRQLQDYMGEYQEYAEKNKSMLKAEMARFEESEEAATAKVKAKSKMSKAEKAAMKKDKAKSFASGQSKRNKGKNSKRWQ